MNKNTMREARTIINIEKKFIKKSPLNILTASERYDSPNSQVNPNREGFGNTTQKKTGKRQLSYYRSKQV